MREIKSFWKKAELHHYITDFEIIVIPVQIIPNAVQINSLKLVCRGDFSWQVRKIFLISESGFVGRVTYKELEFSESLKDEIPKTCSRTFISYSETQQIFTTSGWL